MYENGELLPSSDKVKKFYDNQYQNGEETGIGVANAQNIQLQSIDLREGSPNCDLELSGSSFFNF